MPKRPSEFDAPEPVSSPNHHDNSSPASGDANYSAWDTNQDKNPYHPVHFDGHGNREKPLTATYNVTDADYFDDDDNDSESYCGGPPFKSSKSSPPDFDVRDFTNPKTKQSSYWYHTKLDAQPPAGLMYFYVAAYYCKEIALIDDEHKNHDLHLQDANRCRFLKGMCKTDCSLTCADEPDNFNINCDQKIKLNQFIHFALMTWEDRQTWYHERRCSAIKKNSFFCLIPQPWQNIKPPGCSTDYVQDICNNNWNSKASASWPLQKNNWLHLDPNLFSKHHDKRIGFGFFTGNKIISLPQTKHKHKLFHFNQYNYSILSDNTTCLQVNW